MGAMLSNCGAIGRWAMFGMLLGGCSGSATPLPWGDSSDGGAVAPGSAGAGNSSSGAATGAGSGGSSSGSGSGVGVGPDSGSTGGATSSSGGGSNGTASSGGGSSSSSSSSGSSSSSSGGGRDAGVRDGSVSADSGGSDAALGGDSGDPLAAARAQCVAIINMDRATLNPPSPPLIEATAQESCVDMQAQADYTANKAHSAWQQCKESAQDECPDWPGPPSSIMTGCLAQMWAEGPPPPGVTDNHWLNMSNKQYTKVACGFYQEPGTNRYWATQDFW